MKRGPMLLLDPRHLTPAQMHAAMEAVRAGASREKPTPRQAREATEATLQAPWELPGWSSLPPDHQARLTALYERAIGARPLDKD